MKKLILLAMLYLPCMGSAQSVKQPDSDSTFGFIGFGINYSNWEKAPSATPVHGSTPLGFYGEFMNEGYFIKNNRHWSFAMGFIGQYDVINSSVWLGKDVNTGKNIIIPIPAGTSYVQNTIATSSVGIPLEIHYNIPLGKKDKSKLFISAGYILEYIDLVQTSYTARGDSSTVVNYKKHNNMELFHQEVSARVGIGFRDKKRRWYYISADGFYGLNSIYKSSDGPDLVPYSIAISVAANLWTSK